MPCPFNNYPCGTSPCSQSRPCHYSYPYPQTEYRYHQDGIHLFWLVLSLVFMVWAVNAIVGERYSSPKPDSEFQLQYLQDK